MNLEHLVKDTLEQNGLLDNFPTDYLDTLIKSVNIAFDIFKVKTINKIVNITIDIYLFNFIKKLPPKHC